MSKLSTLTLLLVAVRGQLTGNETCESTAQITHFDWDELMGDETLKPWMDYTLSVDTASLTFIVEADLEYVGYSYADDHTYGFGTTYVLDFEDYDAESDDIREPGNCQNRAAADFGGSWSDLWQYSHTPALEHHLANESTLAYPPAGDRWELTIDNDCTPIKYRGEFTWTQLTNCGNYDDSVQYTVINTDDNWINLTGVFYINLVSPLAHYTDTGYYRVYQMLSAPFVIAVRSQVNIISSVGINLFTLSIIAVYKEDLESDFRLVVLTESADFLMLSAPNLLSSPNPPGGDPITFLIANESLNEGCLMAGANLCSQLWEIYANDVSCPPTNFTGDYSLEFTTTCNPDANYTNGTELCLDYIATYGAQVGLTAALEWLDEICDPEVFIIQFTGTMTFYTDDTWSTEVVPPLQYALGDRAYVQVVIDMPANAYDIFGVTLNEVWVCTINPENEPLAVDAQTGAGGCNTGGTDFKWHIVKEGSDYDDTDAGDVILYPAANATMRFSFMVDSSISRVNLYVQAQVSIDLTATPRRRMLLQAGDDATATQTRHFEGATGINPEAVVVFEGEGGGDVVTDLNPETEVPTWITIGVCVGIANICLISICGFMYFFKKKGSNKTQEIVNIMAAMQQKQQTQPNNVNVVVQKEPQTPQSPQFTEMQTPHSTKGSPVADESQTGYPATR